MTQDELNPYVGPRPFERKQEDSARFFGRSQEAEEIVSLIFGHPVILVYAQSGAGKTSLFNASVSLKLEENGFDVLPLTRVGGVVPKGIALGDVTNLYIFNALLKMDSDTDPQTLLSTSLCSFIETQARTMEENSPPRPRVIVFDQFEELFTYTPGHWREQRDGFFQQVVEALEADPLLRVVFVIREDFLAELDPYSRSLPERLRTRYRLERLGESAALRAIKDPLVNTHRKFAPGVAEGLVKELLAMKTVDATGKAAEIEGQYVEPVQLQVVCVTLWSGLDPDVTEIQESHLKNFKVNDALSNFYKSAVESAAKETGVPEAELRNWFGKTLITSMGTRSTVFRGEESTGGIDNRAVDFLESQHIIRAEFRAGARWYELTHDRLVEPIVASNRLWLEKNSTLLQKQTVLWVAQGRPDGMLLRGKELEQAEAEAQARTLTQDEEDFLVAGNKIREQGIREKRQNLFVRLLASAAITALIVAVGFAVSAKNQAAASRAQKQTAEAAVATATYSLGQANIAKDQAISANATAASARDIVDADRLAGQAQIALSRLDTVSLGQLLAVEAYRLNPGDEEVLPSVYQALYDSAAKGQDKILQDGVFSRAVFGTGANSNWLILDNTLWDLTSFQPVRLADTDKILQTAFGPDGQVVVLTGETGYSYSSTGVNVSIQDKAGRTKNQFALKLVQANSIYDVKVSDDGNWIAASSYIYSTNNEIDLWNLNNPSAMQQYFYPPMQVSTIAISSDGSKLAAAYGSNPLTLGVWTNAGDSVVPVAQIPLASSFTDRIMGGKAGNSLKFSPNGEWLAAMTRSELTIWGTAVGSPVRIPLQTDDQFMGFLFSPDSNSLVYVTKRDCYYSDTCNPNASLVRVVLGTSGQTGTQPILQKSNVEITAMDISPNGRLVIGDWLGYVHAWDLDEKLSDPFNAIVHAGRIASIAIGTDNDTIVSSGEKDGTRIWKLSEKKPVAITVHRFPESISDVIRTTDENSLILGGDYGLPANSYPTISILSSLNDLESMHEIDLSSSPGSLQALANNSEWIAAGRTLKTGYSEDEASFLDFWNLSSTDTSASLTVPLSDTAQVLAFNPSGTTLAIASSKNIWVDSMENIQKQGFKPTTTNPSAVNSGSVKTKFQTELTNGLDRIQTLLFAQNDEYLIGASPNSVHIWTLKNPAEYNVQNASYPIHLSRDQVWLVTGSPNNTLNVYQVSSIMGNTPVVVNTHSAVTQFAFSEDGNWLAVAVASGKVLIYQFPVKDNSEPYYYFQGPRDTTWLEFSPQWPTEKWLVASSGYSAYLWDLNKLDESNRTTNDNPVNLWGHRGNLLYAGFVGDGKWIMTAATDQTVRFWSMNPEDLVQAACVYAGRNLTPTEWNAYLEGDPHQTCEGFSFTVAEASPTPTAGPTQSSATEIAPFATSTELPTPSITFTTYTVKQGDVLGGIAAKFGISLDTLIADNGITNVNMISVGQTLKIRVVKTP